MFIFLLKQEHILLSVNSNIKRTTDIICISSKICMCAVLPETLPNLAFYLTIIIISNIGL